MDLRVFLVANPFRLRLKRIKDMRRPGTWELFQLYTGYSLVIEHTLKGTPTPRTWLLVSRHTKVQVWGKLVSKSLQLLFKDYPSLQKDQLWLTDRKKIYRKKKNDEWVKKKWWVSRIMPSNLGSMPVEPWNLILIKHGCEQQIEKKEGWWNTFKEKKSLDMSRIFVVH